MKKECINEVASMEDKLWLTHCNMACEMLAVVIREKCTGCEMNEPYQLGHELCIMSSSEEQVNLCFEEVYDHLIWDEDSWYKKIIEDKIR